MKALFFICISLFAAACSQTGPENWETATNSPEDYCIVPKPVRLDKLKGRFPINEKTCIYAPSSLTFEARYLAQIIRQTAGEEVDVNSDVSAQNGIMLLLDNTILTNEGYSLNIHADKIELRAKTAAGIFYGIQTIRQLLPVPSRGKIPENVSIPAASITDAPRYAYRGMHLDVARHFFSVKFVKEYIDLLALHKMNRFHWHLTDDQGWRIEIKKYPKLTDVGSIRRETIIGKNFDPYEGDGKQYGGFYTQEQIKDIVRYAQERHITIVPEIEMPGHSSAALRAYPQYGNGTDPYNVATKWGVFDQIYAPTDSTFHFLEDVLSEVMALFPGEYIHIGGDEVPKTEWKNSKIAQDVMRKNKLKDENELQSYFIQRIEKFVNSKGRRIIGWDEILEGGLAPNATVMSWRGTDGGIAAAKMGHDVVMTPGEPLYFDHYQSDPANEPLAIGGLNTVEDVYAYNPTPTTLSPSEAAHIIGAQANLWTEYISSPEYAEYMVLPRMAALAEVVWTPEKEKNWGDFKRRMLVLNAIYNEFGWNHALHMFD